MFWNKTDDDRMPARPNVLALDGSAPRFTDETASLLRHRLRVFSLILASLMTVSFFTSFTLPGLPVRLALGVGAVGLSVLLWTRLLLSLRLLRLVELALFGTFAGNSTYMTNLLMMRFAEAGDIAPLVVERSFYLDSWALYIVGYGLIIPNSWRRTLLLTGCAAAMANLNVSLLALCDPAVGQALASVQHSPPFPLTLAAVIGAVYGAHTLHTVRKQAFDARKFGQYRLVRKLGAGGMGEVYEAEHELLKRPCAIKLIRPDLASASATARFEREVRATAQLSHPNTVDIYDYGRTEDGTFYYVMELLPGMSLQDLVEKHGPLPSERAIHFLTQVCDALTEAHALGMIHRDIKPANVFSARRGGVNDVAKLLDFGIVLVGGEGKEEQGAIRGTPPYMSPEQASGAPLDARSDIYSLGATAYYLVTGTTPFLSSNAVAQVMDHLHTPVTPPSVRNLAVPYDLEQVILRCLAKKPEERFVSARALRDALKACRSANRWDSERAAAWWHCPPASTNLTHPIGQLDATLKKV